MIDFSERDVPADVRDRITDTVHRGVAEPPRRDLRMPLAVAAAVAVLVAAGLVTVLAVRDRTEQVPAAGLPAPPTVRLPAAMSAADDLDLCWQATLAKGGPPQFPPRSDWAVVQREPSPSANVTALRADGKTFFCMTTITKVTLTDPNAKIKPLPGSIRVALVDDDTGWIAGTAPPSKDYVSVDAPHTGYGGGVQPTKGVFLIHVPTEHGLLSAGYIRDGKRKGVTIPPPPARAIELTDRELPPPDRTSAAGKLLGECLERAGWSRSYADQWQPGAVIKAGDGYLVTAVTRGQFGGCVHGEHLGDGSQYSFTPLAAPSASVKVPLYVHDPSAGTFDGPGGKQKFVLGVAPANAKTVAVTTDKGVSEAVLGSGTWAAVVSADASVTSITVMDADGKVFYSGVGEVLGK